MAAERDSNMELLRLISMLVIVAHHYAYFGLTDHLTDCAEAFRAADHLYFIGPPGLFCFVIISGYFMVNSRFTLRKFLRLWGQTWISSVLALLAFLLVLTPAEPITGKIIGKALLPVTRREYWFVTEFIILMLVSPFLNAAFRRFNARWMLGAIAVLALVLCGMQLGGSSSRFIMFVMLYGIGAWLRLYDRATCCFLWPLLGAIAVWIVYRLLGYWVHEGNAMTFDGLQVGSMLSRIESPLTTVAATLLTMAASRMHIGQIRWLNYVAASTFGVYLFHQHPLVCSWLWQSVFTDVSVAGQPWFLLYAAGVTLLVFGGSAIADMLRRHTFDKWFFAAVDRYVVPAADRGTACAAAWLRRVTGKR